MGRAGSSLLSLHFEKYFREAAVALGDDICFFGEGEVDLESSAEVELGSGFVALG